MSIAMMQAWLYAVAYIRREKENMRIRSRTLQFILLSGLGLSPTLFAIFSSSNPLDGNREQIIFGILFIVAFCWFRILFAYHIGKGAERRGCGYGWWVFTTCFFGVFPLGIIYFLFIRWRPSASKMESSSTISGPEKST
jgi:hypothetical protein